MYLKSIFEIIIPLIIQYLITLLYGDALIILSYAGTLIYSMIPTELYKSPYLINTLYRDLKYYSWYTRARNHSISLETRVLLNYIAVVGIFTT